MYYSGIIPNIETSFSMIILIITFERIIRMYKFYKQLRLYTEESNREK